MPQEREQARTHVPIEINLSKVSPVQRFARKDAAENTAVVVVRGRVGVAWVGQVRTAPNAPPIPVAFTGPANGRGSADASPDGPAISATRNSLTATSIQPSVATMPLASA